MKSIGFLVCFGLAMASAASRTKRAAYDLPDGAELLVGAVRTSFSCFGDGYYADIDNNCQIFHVCHTVVGDDGVPDTQQWSFLCGNQTVFNQLTFTCTWPEEAVPCQSSSEFFYLNSNLGTGPDTPFLSDDDVERAAPLIVGLSPAGAAPAPPPQPARPSGGRGGGRFGG